MHRLLIVDDEEIITDGLYEVFRRFMPEELDVCRAYSAREALDWMSRTRIDIVLTDIAMPGMNGMEMTESILAYWPRCSVIFLTGHSEFEYAYRAIQMKNVRYLLKTDGYAKVQDTVREVMEELHKSQLEYKLLEKSREQVHAFEFMAQGDYMRSLLQESHAWCGDRETLLRDFRSLNMSLSPDQPVVLALGRLNLPEGKGQSYSERSRLLQSVRLIWDAHLSEHTNSIGIVDRYGDILWFLQRSPNAEEKLDHRLISYLEGTIELIQEACHASLDVKVGFTISGSSCDWSAVTSQYDRLRRLQQLHLGEGVSMILRDQAAIPESVSASVGHASVHKAEQMAAHLEAGRAAEFFEMLTELTNAMLENNGCAAARRTAEAYYSVALALYSCVNRLGLHDRIEESGKLLRLDDHATMRDGFRYLRQIAETVFQYKQAEERDRASQIIDRICQYIEEHISEDLSLVRLAEIHYFNPSYLSRFFKQERGINLSEYIDKCRIVAAKKLLENGDHKIRDVSDAVGYEAAHSFTRFFKKMTGMTPQEYRDSLSAG
jgi:two-component system, response regulator YesN